VLCLRPNFEHRARDSLLIYRHRVLRTCESRSHGTINLNNNIIVAPWLRSYETEVGMKACIL